jgi:hypothetical protein
MKGGGGYNGRAPSPQPSPIRDCVTMSLRGSETTEAISQCSENKEIAALPSVARNDKPRITTQSLKGEEKKDGIHFIVFDTFALPRPLFFNFLLGHENV